MCDTLGKLGKNLSIFAKNSDRSPNEVQLLEYHPAREGLSGELKCTYITIPQAERTYGVLLSRPEWMWGAEMGVNEWGLCIGNEAVFTKGAYGKQGLTGMDMVRLALERCRGAREALELLVQLLEQYGQGGNCGYDHDFYYDNAFLIMDRQELYVLETAGKKWVYDRRETANISNRLSLGLGCTAYSGASEDFCKRHTEPVYTTFSGSGKRCELIQSRLPQIHTPLDAMDALRLHSHGGAPFCRGSVSSVCMHFGGLVGDHTTASMVVALEEEGIFIWATGCSCPCVSLFKPWTFGTDPVLPVIAPGDPEGRRYWLQAEHYRRELLGKRIPEEFYAQRDKLQECWFRDTGRACVPEEEAFYAAWPADKMEPGSCSGAFRRRWTKKNEKLNETLKTL